MNAGGGVQVQHQPDPTRQSWRNNNSPPSDQGKRKDSNKGKPISLKSINVERAQNLGTASRTNSAPSATQRTPKTAQFPKQQTSASPPQTIFVSSKSEDSDLSNASAGTIPQKSKSTGSTRPTPKPLNLSKSSQMQNFGRVPQTATFPPKVNRALNLPQPPKTATFPKSQSFKDIRQSVRISQPYTFVYNDQTYIQAVPESPRIRRYSASPAPLRFVPSSYRQVEMNSGTPLVVLSHPEDSDSQGSSPPTPGIFPEGYGSDIYDTYVPYDEEIEDNQFYYYYYDYPQEYIPQTPTGTSHPRSSTLPIASKEQRRRSVLSGPMKVHPDAILPIRQPKGPDMAKNFATRIRRKAVNKLYAAAAERRSKSAADRRKSALF